MTSNESSEPAPPLDAAAIAAKIDEAKALLSRARNAGVCTDASSKRVDISELGRRVTVSDKIVDDDQLNAALHQAVETRAQEFIASLIAQAQRLLAEAAGGGDT